MTVGSRATPMLDLTLIRHAATDLNHTGRYQGGCDPDLSQEGVSQALALRARLAVQRPAVEFVWTSDRKRAWRTASLALPGTRLEHDARLRELDFGVFDGCTYAENLARHGDVFERWLADPWNVRPPAGETLGELMRRLTAWLHALPCAGSALVVTHGGPIAAMLALALRIPFAEARRRSPAPAEGVQLCWSSQCALMTPVFALEEEACH